MSVEVRNVSKVFREQKALDKISFRALPGMITGFLGPNGAGKSTTMKIITCFIPPTSGMVYVNNKSIFEWPVEIKKEIGYLPEHNPLYPDMYVREFLHFIAGIHKIKNPVQRVKEIIGWVGLTPEQHKKIGSLSKGFRQRVGLAQALIHDPSVLILDEPTSGLDPNQLQEIRELIRTLSKEKTVILSTHIMQEVEALCQRVVIINKGKIVADDDVSALKSMGRARESLIVEFNQPVDKDALLKIVGVSKAEKITDSRWKLILADDTHRVHSELLAWAYSRHIVILSLQKEISSMEEVFKQLTRQN